MLMPMRQTTSLQSFLEHTGETRESIWDGIEVAPLRDGPPTLQQTGPTNCTHTVLGMIALEEDPALRKMGWFDRFLTHGATTRFARTAASEPDKGTAVRDFNELLSFYGYDGFRLAAVPIGRRQVDAHDHAVIKVRNHVVLYAGRRQGRTIVRDPLLGRALEVTDLWRHVQDPETGAVGWGVDVV